MVSVFAVPKKQIALCPPPSQPSSEGMEPGWVRGSPVPLAAAAAAAATAAVSSAGGFYTQRKPGPTYLVSCCRSSCGFKVKARDSY